MLRVKRHCFGTRLFGRGSGHAVSDAERCPVVRCHRPCRARAAGRHGRAG